MAQYRSNVGFSSKIRRFTEVGKARLTAVWRGSLTELVITAHYNMPYRTGFLRASQTASTTRMPQSRKDYVGLKSGAGAYASQADAALNKTLQLIKTLNATDKLFVSWRAGYAGFIEYGTVKAAAQAPVGRALSQWQIIVNRQVGLAKERIR